MQTWNLDTGQILDLPFAIYASITCLTLDKNYLIAAAVENQGKQLAAVYWNVAECALVRQYRVSLDGLLPSIQQGQGEYIVQFMQCAPPDSRYLVVGITQSSTSTSTGTGVSTMNLQSPGTQSQGLMGAQTMMGTQSQGMGTQSHLNGTLGTLGQTSPQLSVSGPPPLATYVVIDLLADDAQLATYLPPSITFDANVTAIVLKSQHEAIIGLLLKQKLFASSVHRCASIWRLCRYPHGNSMDQSE